MPPIRYHVQLEKGRTSISVDTIVSELLALKLGTRPGTKAAHTAVRRQIEQFITHDRNRAGAGLASYIRRQAILHIADTMLSEKYWDYFMERLEEEERHDKKKT